jgi:hypothetical protein
LTSRAGCAAGPLLNRIGHAFCRRKKSDVC